VDFWAPWCGPCQAIDPAIKKLGQEYEGRVDVWKVNADEHPEILGKLRIYGIPTLVGFKGGQEVARRTGAAPAPVLAGLFEAALSGEKPAQRGVSPMDRLLRTAIGLALIGLGFTGGFSGVYLVLTGVGGLVLFSAFHDRCPIWQAIKPRLQELVKRSQN
jgi:thioredoxin